MKLLATALAALLATQVAAQPRNCAPRDTVVERLQSKYGETRQAMGVAGRSLMEVWANEESGSWTILLTMPGGISCLGASGQSYEELSEALVDGDPA
ncbi:hypothetical protein Q5Y75_05585 [Ruegeria sp. 2205SS24-7]|uniref:hypothetical protein n=1 Tax=Ruegeria discodermiae TaxID=3064389 RepID=UPI00274158CB|nr:hypothetical protein [Ruegeria sp. 2205SS24-7]MDP5216682.1 hypothetical protein [Ruegeria sp. 2205SS24-7]